MKKVGKMELVKGKESVSSGGLEVGMSGKCL